MKDKVTITFPASLLPAMESALDDALSNAHDNADATEGDDDLSDAHAAWQSDIDCLSMIHKAVLRESRYQLYAIGEDGESLSGNAIESYGDAVDAKAHALRIAHDYPHGVAIADREGSIDWGDRVAEAR